MPNNVGLVRAAMALRGVHTALWAEFVKAMNEYAVSIQADMLKVTPDMLSRAQGMALMAHEIAGVLRDAPELYEKMQGKHVDARQRPKTIR